MRFRLIDAEKARLPIDRMCALLAVSASGYYAWAQRGPSRRQLDDLVLLAHVRAHFAASNGTYGSPRMHAELCAAGVSIGRHRTARIVAKNPSAPVTLLRTLIRSEDEATRRCVVLNRRAPYDVLSDLENQFPELFVNNPALELYNSFKI